MWTFDSDCATNVLIFRIKEKVSFYFLHYVLVDNIFLSKNIKYIGAIKNMNSKIKNYFKIHYLFIYGVYVCII